jgi:hypothetical protein
VYEQRPFVNADSLLDCGQFPGLVGQVVADVPGDLNVRVTKESDSPDVYFLTFPSYRIFQHVDEIRQHLGDAITFRPISMPASDAGVVGELLAGANHCD